jgi:hypothetical protein
MTLKTTIFLSFALFTLSSFAQQDSTSLKLDLLKKKMPLKLYFHNDKPNPKSLEVTTKDDYLELARNYQKLQAVYTKEASSGLHGKELEQTIIATKDLFENYLTLGINDLEIFSQNLLYFLDNGHSVDLKLKGYASPLAKSDYNLNLTKRRINSLKNYLRNYQKGKLIPYLDELAKNGAKLTFTDIPFGSEKAATNVSSDLYDQRKSVYSKAAALERRIEILEINIVKSPKPELRPKNLSKTEAETDNISHDFGTIKYGEIVEHTFKIKNTGNADLIIYKALGSCGCTVPQYSESPVKPGDYAEVKIIFDTKGKLGKQNTQVMLVTNTSREKIFLNIAANVELKK